MLELKKYRLMQGLSQTEVARRIGVMPNTITQYESGAREPSLETLIKLSDLFGCSLDDMVVSSEISERDATTAEVQTHTDSVFGSIRSVVIKSQPFFVAKDVAKALGYSNPQKAVRDHVDDEDRMVNDSFTVNGTPLTFINECGLYSLILQSKLPTARKFKRWVISSVLPSIRQTGSYSVCNNTVEQAILLSTEDYLTAARLIATCKQDRLPIVIDLLSKGGWGIDSMLTYVKSCNTNDIREQIDTVLKETGVSLQRLAELCGISYAVFSTYHTGRRYPRPERYMSIVSTLTKLKGGCNDDR